MAIAALSDVEASEVELREFVAAYEALRGAERVEYCPPSDGFRAAVIAAEGWRQSALWESDGSWTAFAGVLYGVSPSPGARLEEADGHFGLISFDAGRRRMIVATDAFGVQAMYVAESEGRAYVSTSAMAIARHLRLPADRFRARSFVRTGFHVGDSTLWEGVRRLEPGTALELGRAGRTELFYWRPTRDEAVTRLGLAKSADHVLEVAVGAAAAYLGSRPCTWADLSGGHDSRLLALILDRAGVDFSAATRGDPGDEEARVAGRVAELGGWEWRLFPYPASWKDEAPPLLPKAVAWGDGYVPILHLARRFWKHERTAEVCPSLVGGAAGELLRDFAWQQEFIRAGRSTRVDLGRWVDMRLLRGHVDLSLFASDPTAAVRDDLTRRFQGWLEAYSDEPNTFQLDLLYAYRAGTGRYGGEASAELGILTRQWPYLYRPILTAAISTHWRHRKRHRLVRQMTERLDPVVAAVPTSWWHAPVQPMRLRTAHRFAPYYLSLGRRGARKLTQKAFGRSFARSPAVDPRETTLRRAVLAYAGSVSGEGLDPSTMRTGPIYRQDRLGSLLAAAGRDDFRQTDVMDRILTVELALRATDTALSDG